MQENTPNSPHRRTALLALAVSMTLLTGFAVGYVWITRGAGGGGDQTAAAAPESAIAATCGEQVYFLLNYFMYDEAIERLRDCPDAADGYELSHLAKETYRILDIYKDADVSHPLAGLPFHSTAKVKSKKPSPEPSVGIGLISRPVGELVAYRKALAAFGRKDYSMCLQLLDRAGSDPPLEDYWLHLMALAAFNSGDYRMVHGAIAEFSGSYRESLLYPDMRVLEAGALVKEGLEESALSLLMKVAEDINTREGRGKLLTAAAGIHAAAGRADEVVKTILLIVDEGIDKGEDDTFADPMWDMLKEVKWENVSPGAAVKIGAYLLDAGWPYRALTILQRAAKVHSDLGVQLLLGKAELATGRAKDAEKRFDSIQKKSNDQYTLREACIGSARALKALKKRDEAVRVYYRCHEKYANYKYVPLQELAWMLWWANEETKALAVMKQLVEQFPRLEENDAVFRLLGREAYLERKYDEALEYFGAIVRDFPDSVQVPHALFWMGKIYADRGDEEKAVESFSKIVEDHPYTYFYYRVRGSGQTAPPWEGVERGLQAAVSAVNGDIHLKNGYALLAAGMVSEALREFRFAGRGGVGEPTAGREAAVGVSFALRKQGKYIESIKTLEKTIEADAGWFRRVMASGALRELLFPTLYKEEVEAAAREFGAEKATVFAVIRQESRFDRTARSSSNAMGLMQIIPSTGIWSARNMGIRGFETKKLYEPGLNVRMGTWYLKQMNEKFGSFPLALAAYNWGPGNLTRWQRNHPDPDVDRFIESIPRAETRRYVKNCLLNYYVYESINIAGSGF